MSTEEDLILILARSISDGVAVDWSEVETGASSERQRAIIRELRLIAEVAGIHRDATTEDVASEPEPPFERWGHLQILEKLGSGGFGDVYRARDTRLDRDVALKILRRPRALEGASADDFRIREARQLARVRHPNVVTIHGADVIDGRAGLWMELVRGRTLDDLLREHGPIPASRAARVGIDLCRALQAVHAAKLVHRDLKASNVMVEEGGRIVLMDFGAGGDFRTMGGGAGVARTGTPAVMAPEVLRGQESTIRSDLYSLGALLHRVATGEYPPAPGEPPASRGIAESAPDGNGRARPLPPRFARILEKALAPDPEDRFASAAEMEQALARAVAPRGWRLPLLAACFVVGATGIAWLATRTSGTDPPAYTIQASFFRKNHDGSRTALHGGDRVAVDDAIVLEIEASHAVHVYVLNEDERGAAYWLFPLEDGEPRNPLSPLVRHQLPGFRGDRERSWGIGSAGGREHFLVVASPRRLDELEAVLAGVPRPQIASTDGSRRLPASAIEHLRGASMLKEARVGSRATSRDAGRLFEKAARIISGPEQVRGAWVRQVDFDNPGP